MNEFLVTMLTNIVLGGLLVAVIVYCRRLNRSIKVLQDSKSELAQMFREFDDSIARAAESVDELRESAKKTDAILKEKLEKANLLADDLSFMIERGNRTADKLETNLNGRTSAPANEAAASAPAKPDHLSALAAKSGKAQPATAPKEPSFNTTGAERKSSTASIESVLEQIANRNNPAPGAGNEAGGRKTNSRIRSKAEQELFDSLKSGR